MRHEALLEEIRREFPRFAIVPKRQSALQRAIGVALLVVTAGGQRSYMTRYHTVLFGRLYVPDSWDAMGDDDRYILLRHERVHLRQRRRMGDPLMAFVYLVPFLPLFLAWGRARIEWEAYVETIRATAEVRGLAARAAPAAGDRAALRGARLRLDVALSPRRPALVRRGHRRSRGRGARRCARRRLIGTSRGRGLW